MIATSNRFTKCATAIGHYWRSKLPAAALRTELRGNNLSFFKEAALGGEQESGFEQAFSSLAYSLIKDKAPRLLDYVVGFQLVDRSEDNTKAMGVFGFKVGDQWLYGPVFFLNGDLKGHELLYLKKSDTFVPMSEDWVNHVISRKPHTLGKGSDKDTFQLGGLMPNLTRLTRPPLNNKYGADASCGPCSTSTPCRQPGCLTCGTAKTAALSPAIADWAKPALPMLCALMNKLACGLYPQLKTAVELNFPGVVEQPFKAALASQAVQFDLHNALRDFPLLKTAFERCYQQYPALKQGFDRFYGPTFFADVAKELRDDIDDLVGRTKRAESYLVPPPHKRKRKRPDPSLFAETDPVPKKAEIEVIALEVDDDSPITVNRPELTEDERQKLLRDTVLIKDKRDPHGPNSSIAYNTQIRLELVNPSDSGLYEILEKPGSFDEMIVLSNPHSGRGREDFCLLVRKSDPRSWLNIHRTGLWARSCDCPVRADFEKYIDGLGGVDALKKGGTYIAVHANGSGTCPFRIREDYGDGSYGVAWKDYCSQRRSSALPQLERTQDYELDYHSWNAKVFINKRKGTGLRSVNGELSIPEDYKIIKVADPPKPKKEPGDLVEACCSNPPMLEEGDGAAERPIDPGNLVDVQLLLQKNASALSLYDTGAGEVWLYSRLGQERMTKKAALISLVRDHGLHEPQAREMLKQAAVAGVRSQRARFLVKYAYGFADPNLQPGPTAPSFPEALRGIEMNGPNAVQSIYPQEEFLPVDDLDSGRTDPSVYDPWYTPDAKSMQVAQQASLSGQKEVFDTSMISGLLKSVNKRDLVDKYLGDLMKATDRLGRILFLFYWHNDEFRERYGEQDLPELEDSIRNAFEAVSKVALFLKEKTVQGAGDLDASVGQNTDPDVASVARN